MTGSRGSPVPRGGQPQQPWPHESDERARAIEYERWLQQQRDGQHQGYASPRPEQQPAAPHYGVPQSDAGYTHIHPADGQHLQPGGYPPAEPRLGNSYAPQFQPYAPPMPLSDRESHGRLDPAAAGQVPFDHRQTDLNPFGQRSAGQPIGYGREPQAEPYPRSPAAYPPAHEPPPVAGAAGADPRSWHFSQYQPGQIPADYAAPGQPSHGAPDAHHGQSWPPPRPGEPQWHQDGGGGHWPAHGGHPGAGHGEFGQQAAPYGTQSADPRFDAHGGDQGAGYGGAELDPVEEPRRGPSTLVIVSALVGAIAIGGGLAFAYKQFGGGRKDTAKVAELKRPTGPAKERPQDPGGKTFEHADKKFPSRLTPEGQSESASATRGSDVDGGAKKVATIPIVVNRDGTLSPQAPQPAAAPPSSGGSGVPGLLIDGMGPPPLKSAGGGPVPAGSPGGASAAAARIPPPPPPVVRAAPPAQQAVPRVADLPLPKVISQQPQPPQQAAEAEAAVARAPVPKKKAAAPRDDLLAQQTGGAQAEAGPSGLGSAAAKATPKPAAASGGAGYVAVLASKKSRQDALNSFADLHSQYPDILTGMTPDVREANLGDKGLWYRLIVGPPGSREAARTLCVKLKERGMKDCWPVAY